MDLETFERGDYAYGDSGRDDSDGRGLSLEDGQHFSDTDTDEDDDEDGDEEEDKEEEEDIDGSQ